MPMFWHNKKIRLKIYNKISVNNCNNGNPYSELFCLNKLVILHLCLKK